MSWLAELAILVQIAFRNLFAHRLKTLIIGGIILAGALLLVVGGTLLDSIDQSIQRSIQGSVAGHVQIYSAKSKDELALFGDFGGFPDLSPMHDFARIKETLEKLPEVKAVVPMGINGALITSGNSIDVALGKLRAAVNKKLAGDTSPATLAEIEAQKRHVRQMCKVLEGDLENLKALADEKMLEPRDVESIHRAASDQFWAEFDAAPLDNLEFLENRIAPLRNDGDLLWVSYIGTDFDAFTESFDRLEIVDGTAPPRGERGFLFPKFYYEDQLKLKNARRLDLIHTAITVNKRSIADDPELRRFVAENKAQTREIVFQLDAAKTDLAVARLQAFLGSRETDVDQLLSQFFEMNDQNFLQRYDFFYKELAPLVELYRIPVGSTFTIKAFTKTGYIQSVNLKVWGTFQFKGLEKSGLAGTLGLMDLVSFRELYGFVTAAKAEEVQQLKQKAGARELDREQAEAALFGAEGDAPTIVAEATPGFIDEMEELPQAARELRREEMVRRLYTREEVLDGEVLNAAVILEDPRAIDEGLKAVEEAVEREKLGVKVVSWQTASGFLGQFALLAKIVLYAVVCIIFVVALLIINNSMVIATLERVKEIGTLRAIGAQRPFVLWMLLIETLVLGAIFGTGGLLLGSGIVAWMQATGIPATTEEMYFFFSGPRLHPSLQAATLVAAFVIVTLVSVLSAVYPALLAVRVAPVVAMQAED